MKAMHVDFAPRSAARAIASMQVGHWLLVALALVAAGGGMIASYQLAQQQEARQAALEQIQAQIDRRAAAAAVPRRSSIPEAQASAVNLAVQQLNLPWGRLLTAFERATPATVAVLGLEPDSKSHLVRGVAEARTTAVMFAYITRLKQQPFLGNVILTKHEVNDQDENRPVRFEFEAEWPEADQ